MAMAASTVTVTVTGTVPRHLPRCFASGSSARRATSPCLSSCPSRSSFRAQAQRSASVPGRRPVQIQLTESSAQGSLGGSKSGTSLTTHSHNRNSICNSNINSNSIRRSDSSGIRVGRRGGPVGGVECRASAGGADAEKVVYPGVYGPWSVETSDKVEVLLYRAGLNLVSFSLLLCSLPVLLPSSLTDPSSSSPLSPLLSLLSSPLPQTVLFWTGTSALGLSLFLIHIYVTPIKRTLQGLWAGGALGALALSYYATSSEVGADVAGADAAVSVVQFVVDHPAAVWAVGPMFAALTGLVFKEGLCYGKLEAAVLFFIIPSLLLGHLSGVMGADVERPLLGAWVLLSLVFSLRKFTQPLKDDIGDKSVFLFQALPREEQEKLLAGLERRE